MSMFDEGLTGLVFVFTLLILVGTMGYVSVVTSDTQLSQILGHDRVDYNETGYVEDVEFLGGGFMDPTYTLIRFTNGDVVTLKGRKTEIPLKQNVTLYYHDNGFGLYFLDKFEKKGGEQK